MTSQRRLIIVMGVAGCGKSTIGAALASRLGASFIEGDDYHPAANVEKMRAGTPLDDADRAAWLNQIGQAIAEDEAPVIVLACSALTPYTQDRLKSQLDTAAPIWIHLQVDREVAEHRMRSRQHFMPASLIDSQFSALTPPPDALNFDAGLPIESLVTQIQAAIDA